MRVSPTQPFQIVYSLYQHEYLGYLFESFAIELDQKGNLSLKNQNISKANASEFSSGITEHDLELIKLMDSMQQDAVIFHFTKKKTKPDEFFKKVYNQENGNKALQAEIESYLERRRAAILKILKRGGDLYEMGTDGEPAWRKITIQEQAATVLFHFRKNEENTHYFPTVKHDGEKVDFQYNGSVLICSKPAWLLIKGKLYYFAKDMDGNKLSPFLNKKFILIPQKVEETYYTKFVVPLVEQYDVYAKGFTIQTIKPQPEAFLTFTELSTLQENLFVQNTVQNNAKILFELKFKYGKFDFKRDTGSDVVVKMEKEENSYIFYRIIRNIEKEGEIQNLIKSLGLALKGNRADISKPEAFGWISRNRQVLFEQNIMLFQQGNQEKKFYIGPSSIKLEVRENIDWFDIHAIIRFGDYEISFKQLRKLITSNINEIKLPNGEVAVIPEEWVSNYGDLMQFSEESEENSLLLRKHHLALVQELESGSLATVMIDKKMENLRSFEKIEDVPLPNGFKGELRPYQKAGFNWMNFLRTYRFGGCLADDMGLGKTVQTLAMLQQIKEDNQNKEGQVTSLLIMPTSLIYNWENEAKKFTPELKVFNYTGTNRIKDVSTFEGYDLVLTSYGIIRLDIEILKTFYFNYIILDESQAIKNPGSIIAKSVKELTSRYKLILTGTPLENSTLDLWSQLNFINPGLLGNQKFFKKEYQIPIEKKGDTLKVEKLHKLIKPFILRRNKLQVAADLPEKVENVQYCTMTEDQRKIYEDIKSEYRSKILDHIESHGINKTQFMVLQGLSKLRQIANHPAMTDEGYTGDSGKMEELSYMIENTLVEGHKILIFSQFVKHLGLVRKYLDKQNIQYNYLDGSTKDRQAQVEDFQHNPSKKIFLISLKAGGLGLNLTQADYVFLLDPWWNPAIEAQAIDRAHRIGQTRHVFTYRFITRDTVEEKIRSLQKMKQDLASNLVSTEDGFMKSLSREDIESILD